MTERPYPPASPPPVFGRTPRAHVARHTSIRQELLRSLFHSSEPRCGGRSSQRTSALRLPPRCCFTVLGYEYYPFSPQHGGYGVRTQRGRVAVSLACKVLDSYWLGVVSANLGKDAWAFCGIGVIGRTGDVRGPHSRERSPLKGAPGGPAGRLWGETLVCFPILSLSRGQVDVELIGTSSPPWAFALPVLLCEAPGPQGHLSLSFIHSWESLWWK